MDSSTDNTDVSTSGKTVSKKQKQTYSVIVCLAQMVTGILATLIPPSLLDIIEMLDSDIEQLSFATGLGLASHAAASLIAGFLFGYVNRQLCIFTCIIGLSVCMVIVPFTSSFPFYLAATILAQSFYATIDVGTASLTLEMWEVDAAPYMTSQLFFFTAGSCIAPVLVSPFLSHRRAIDMETNGTVTQIIPHTRSSSRIEYPFGIAAIIGIVAAVIFGIICVKYPYKQSERSMSKDASEGDDGKKRSPVYYFVMVILSSLVCCFYTGATTNFSSFFAPFIEHNFEHSISRATVARMLASLSGISAVTFILTIILVTKIPIIYITWLKILLVMLSNSILLLFADKSQAFVWASVAVFGAGDSGTFAAILSLLEQKMNVTPVINGILGSASCLAGVLNSFLTGHYIEEHPVSFLQINLISLTVCIIALTCMQIADSDCISRIFSKRASFSQQQD